ncbi:unnamed protein product [Penicillium discolor]
MADNTPAGLRKRGLGEVDGCSSPRSPSRRRLVSKSAEPAESLLPYPIPDDNSVSSDGQIPPLLPDNESDDRPPVSDEQVGKYYQKGATYEAWIADPTRDGCPCAQSEHTLFGILNHSDKKKRFHCSENQFADPPPPIQDDLAQLGFPTKEGVIIGECIYRYAGPNWSDIALAQYKFDHPIDTLKYLYFTNVQNEETLPYVQEILYPRHDVDWPCADRIESQVWEYGTEEYREILGTKLGNAAACLILGAWERGTHCIARVHTLGRQYHIHLRFDIEPVPVSGTA